VAQGSDAPVNKSASGSQTMSAAKWRMASSHKAASTSTNGTHLH
jgi:hypothetical protein